MTVTKPKRRSPETKAQTRDRRGYLARTVRRVSGLVGIARTGATMIVARMPGTMRATRAGAHGTTSALQTLPDPTLRWLAASSAGLSAGFYLAGAPRLVVAAGIAPAFLMGAAIVLRPNEPTLTPP